VQKVILAYHENSWKARRHNRSRPQYLEMSWGIVEEKSMSVRRHTPWAACLALAVAATFAHAQSIGGLSLPTKPEDLLPTKPPKVELPKPPKVDLPKPPKVHLPKPKIDLPKPPKIDLPKPPKIGLPDVSKLDPVEAARKKLKEAQASAMKELKKLDPDGIFREVKRSLGEVKAAAQARTGLKFDERTGDVDLRGHPAGKTLNSWMDKFAQGNEGKGELEEFRYNVKTRVLALRLKARHRQRQDWGVLGKVDLYSCTQTAKVTVNCARGEVDFAIDFGPLAPKLNSKSFKALADGDLIAAAEAASPGALGKLVGTERKNDYDKVYRAMKAKYGDNVYMSSREFVGAAGSQKIGKYAATAFVSGGSAVLPQIMKDLKEMAAKELPHVVAWLEGRGEKDARRMAEMLLTGRKPSWPHLKVETVAVPYYAREANINKEWRRFDNLGFILVIEPRYSRK
jgi:hypothetical protein